MLLDSFQVSVIIYTLFCITHLKLIKFFQGSFFSSSVLKFQLKLVERKSNQNIVGGKEMKSTFAVIRC